MSARDDRPTHRGPKPTFGAGRPRKAGPTGGTGGSAGGAARGRGGSAGGAARGRGGRSSEPARDVHDPDGVVVRELGVRVDPTTAVIHVDGMRIQLDASLITVVLNKPAGVVSTMDDPEGRPSLAQFVADRPERLFHVGRLDAETEGLLLLTNDGELANRLAHPSFGVRKTYLATVEGRVKPALVQQLRAGVDLEDGPVKVDSAKIVDSSPDATMLEVVLHEGRNRVVRRVFDAIGHPVTRLLRTQVGPVHLGNLPPGRTRVLGRAELGALMASVGL